MRKLKNYIRYFSYFFSYYPLLAVFILYDEIRGENKYHLDTTGFEEIDPLQLRKPAAFHAYSYMPSNYVLLERVFREINNHEHNQTLLDLGCGKGRAMLVAA